MISLFDQIKFINKVITLNESIGEIQPELEELEMTEDEEEYINSNDQESNVGFGSY